MVTSPPSFIQPDFVNVNNLDFIFEHRSTFYHPLSNHLAFKQQILSSPPGTVLLFVNLHHANCCLDELDSLALQWQTPG